MDPLWQNLGIERWCQAEKGGESGYHSPRSHDLRKTKKAVLYTLEYRTPKVTHLI